MLIIYREELSSCSNSRTVRDSANAAATALRSRKNDMSSLNDVTVTVLTVVTLGDGVVTCVV